MIRLALAAALAVAHLAAARPAVVGADHGVAGFNTELSCCTDPWSSWMGESEAIRGAFRMNQHGVWSMELVSAASANAHGVSYRIRPDANWYWGGRKVPVTYRDFVYTLQQMDDPLNDVADRSGYASLDPTRFTHHGDKEVTFYWRRAPYADWQSLFSTLYPSFALRGKDFNSVWTSCICGSDGKPVADGPYYLAAYDKLGATLKANPYWSRHKPAVREIDFRVFPGPASAVQAMSAGALDAIAPAFGPYLEQVKATKGLTYVQIPGYSSEHLDFREGPGSSNALLRAPFIREAIAYAVDRTAIIEAVFGDFAGPVHPLDDALYYATETGYRRDFRRWGFNPRNALALMAKHCTGGPPSVDPANTSVWTCSGLPAVFTWSWPTGDTTRTVTEAIAKAELRAVGIDVHDQPVAPNVFYGASGVSSGAYDIAELADVTSGDPGDWYDVYRCGGPLNITGFCSHRVDAFLRGGMRALAPRARQLDFRRADAAFAKALPVLPLYQHPDVLVHRSNLLGLVESPAAAGPFWNVENWKWR
jgi:ABC-type transport system substrate-binding protein